MRIKNYDTKALQNLSMRHGERVRFNYIDAKGKHTSVDTRVDSTTVLPNSILTYTPFNGYKRYLFNRIQTDITTGNDD